jgi:hypothetical protein
MTINIGRSLKMSHSRKVIVVTGPPRSGTTPVGDIVAHTPGAVSLYEPWGPTGDVRFGEEFPIVGAGSLSQDDFTLWINDLRRLKLQLGAQSRPSHKDAPFFRRLLLNVGGSRSLHSYRLARLRPFADTIIWKDPHAFLSLPALLDQGLPTVVTLRSPFAGAASYKRMGWVTQLEPIYRRYKERYGADALLEESVKMPPCPVRSAASVWRMGALLIQEQQASAHLFLVRSTALEVNETAVYEALFFWLGVDPEKPMAHLANQQSKRSADKKAPNATHDWTRSLAQTNQYWKETLTPEEIEIVSTLAGDLAQELLETA